MLIVAFFLQITKTFISARFPNFINKNITNNKKKVDT